ncbi:MAG: hypothetical protein HYZ53_20700 [Planctomycetes bacterium]|nr:hypothetical protein [Planctomycetota bacterium]
MAKTDWAIVMGVSKYPALGDLDGAERDASEFRDWLLTAAGVPKSHVSPIVTSDFHPPVPESEFEAKPTPEHAEKAFDRLWKLAKTSAARGDGLRLGRRLYVYLAGHGFEPKDDGPVLLTANASREQPGYHVAGKLYAEHFLRSGCFEEVLLFMDTCRERCDQAPLRRPPFAPSVNPQAVTDGRFFHGFATRWSLRTREKPLPPDGLPGGIFTRTLLTGLKGAARKPGSEHQVTAHSLKNYLINRMRDLLTPEERKDPDVQEWPEVHIAPDAEDRDFVLVEVEPVLFPVIVHFAPGDKGKRVEVQRGGDFKVVERTRVRALEWRIDLAPDTYQLVIPDPLRMVLLKVSGLEEHHVYP